MRSHARGSGKPSRFRRSRLVVGLVFKVALLATITGPVPGTPFAEAQNTGQSLQTPVSIDEIWCVGQGYFSPNPRSHSGGFGLDLAVRGDGHCSGFGDPGSTGANTYAPVTGTISWIEHNTGTGTLCIDFDSAGDGIEDSSIDVTHIDINSDLQDDQIVTAGTHLGTVADADSSLDNIGVWNAGIPHIHLTVWDGPGCYAGMGGTGDQKPFTGKYKMCGAPDLPAVDPSGNSHTNGVWSGIGYFGAATMSGCALSESSPDTSGQILVQSTSGNLNFKRPNLSSPWIYDLMRHRVSGSETIVDYQIEGDRIGVLTSNGELYVRESINTGFEDMTGSGFVSEFDLDGDGLVARWGSGIFVKTGSITSGWSPNLWPYSVADVQLDGDRLIILSGGNTLYAKEWNSSQLWTAGWTTLDSGIESFVANN